MHASMSEHHPKCGTHKVGGGNGCTCHVAKAKDALNDLATMQIVIKDVEVAAVTVCSCCDNEVENIVGRPNGSELCPQCFNDGDTMHLDAGGLLDEHLSEAHPLSELYRLWDDLGNIPTVFDGEDVDTIEEPFLHFPVGTHREEIWRWFEQQHPEFLVGEVMQGKRKQFSKATAPAMA